MDYHAALDTCVEPEYDETESTALVSKAQRLFLGVALAPMMGRSLGRGGDGEGGGETSEGADRRIRRNRGKATEARDYELIDGEIVMMTDRTETHQQIASNIIRTSAPA